jgi:hypothetical protein
MLDAGIYLSKDSALGHVLVAAFIGELNMNAYQLINLNLLSSGKES